MKKRLLFIVFISLIIISLSFVISQDIPSSVPGSSFLNKIEIDENTGKPEKFTDLEENIEAFRTREQNVSYLAKEWGVIFANNPGISRLLFQTERFFSFFNPFWRIILGTEFSWSFAFSFTFLAWIFIIIFVHPMARYMGAEFLISLVISILISTLFGFYGAYKKFVNIFVVKDISLWIVILIYVILFILVILNMQIFKHLAIAEDEREEKRDKETLKRDLDFIDKIIKAFTGK